MKNKQQTTLKKIILTLFAVFAFAIITQAAYLKNVPQTLTQPDGTTINVFATGDEYYNWLHDANNYTIMLNSTSHYYVYAKFENNQLVATNLVVGKVNPAQSGLTPGLNKSTTEISGIITAQRAAKASPVLTKAKSLKALSKGNYNNIVVFISFSDQGEITTPLSTITNTFNASGQVSVNDFFKEETHNQLNLVSTFYPTTSGTYPVSYKDSHPVSYYSKNTPDGYGGDGTVSMNREHTLLVNAINAIKSQVPADLQIDNDGDGNVDNVVFVLNGSPQGWADLLWPHAWALYSQTATINNKRVWGYNLEFANTLGAGVLSHELSHSLGFPDLYQYNGGVDPVGGWDLMCGTDWNRPQHSLVWQKYKYGQWTSSIPEITQPGTYTLAPVSQSTFAAYKIALPNSTNEFIMLEYRKQEGLYEVGVPQTGLIIYRVNTTLNGNAGGPPDEVFVYRPSTTGVYDAAFSADKNRTSFDNTTDPACTLTDGSLGGLLAGAGITNITAVGNTISFNYNKSTTLRDPENPTNVVNGIDYKYYEGIWNNVPDFNTLTAVKSGNTTNFNIGMRNQEQNFAVNLTGYIDIPADGIYTFTTNSDDGSKLLIGTQVVVNNDGLHSPQEASGSIGLKKGKHAITVSYFQQMVTSLLTVSYSSANIARQEIPASVLYRTAPAANCSGAATNGDYTYDIITVNGQTAIVFKPAAGIATGYAIIHYQITGQGQQNLYITPNSPLVLTGAVAGQVVTFEFTYTIPGGAQRSTSDFMAKHSFTVGNCNVVNPTTCTGTATNNDYSYAYGTSNGKPAIVFTPAAGYGAGYAIIHYQVNGGGMLNYYVTPNLPFVLNNVTTGQVITFSFTYTTPQGTQRSTTDFMANHSFTVGDCTQALVATKGNDLTDSNNNNLQGSISVFPNPTANNVTIYFVSSEANDTYIKIYSILGTEVLSVVKPSTAGINSIELSVADLTNGTYFVSILNGSEKVVQKLTILK